MIEYENHLTAQEKWVYEQALSTVGVYEEVARLRAENMKLKAREKDHYQYVDDLHKQTLGQGMQLLSALIDKSVGVGGAYK